MIPASPQYLCGCDFRETSSSDEISSDSSDEIDELQLLFSKQLYISENQKPFEATAQKIERLLNNSSEGIEWFDRLDTLSHSLHNYDYRSKILKVCDWPYLASKLKRTIQLIPTSSSNSSIYINNHIVFIVRCLKIFKNIGLEESFKNHSEDISDAVSALFTRKFQIKTSFTPGWNIIPQVIEHIRTHEEDLIEQLSSDAINFMKIKRSNDLPISLLFIREGEKKDEEKNRRFNLFATIRFIGNGTTKYAKEISSLTYIHQKKVKLTPHKRLVEEDPSLFEYWQEEIAREALLTQELMKLNVPNLLVMQTYKNEDKAITLSEICEGRTLIAYHKRLPPELQLLDALYILRDALEALIFLHLLEISHLDFKMDNILVAYENNYVCGKLSDLGSARQNGYKGCLTTYPSPEMLQANGNIASPEIDMWSLGLILFALFTKKDLLSYQLSWETAYKDRQKWWKDLRQLMKDLEIIENTYPSFYKIIKQLLDPDPKERIGPVRVIIEIEKFIEENGY